MNQHKVCVNVSDRSGQKQTILRSGVKTLPRKLLTALFGEGTQIVLLAPGHSVESIEIKELKKGDIA